MFDVFRRFVVTVMYYSSKDMKLSLEQVALCLLYGGSTIFLDIGIVFVDMKGVVLQSSGQ